MKAKLIFYGILLVLFLTVGLPAIKSIGDGYSKDMENMMNPDRMMNFNINPNASSFETMVRMTPNGSQAIADKMAGVERFFDGLLTFIFFVAVFIGVIAFVHFRNKAKEEAERERRMKSIYNSSRYSSGGYRGGYYR